MTVVFTEAWLPTKPSSDDDSGFRHGFGAEVSLPLTQSTPAVTHDITRLCWIVVTLWDCHIHADAVKALSCFCFFNVFPLVRWKKSQISQECGSWFGNGTSASDLDRKYVGYLAISDTLFSQILIFFQLTLMHASRNFSLKETVNSIKKNFFNLTDQMTIYRCWVVNVIFQLEIRNDVLNRLQRASPSSYRAMMICAYFYAKVSKYFFL